MNALSNCGKIIPPEDICGKMSSTSFIWRWAICFWAKDHERVSGAKAYCQGWKVIVISRNFSHHTLCEYFLLAEKLRCQQQGRPAIRLLQAAYKVASSKGR